jgi:hypothetical protein
MQPEQNSSLNQAPSDSPNPSRNRLQKKVFLIASGAILLIAIALLGMLYGKSETQNADTTKNVTTTEPTTGIENIKKAAENSPNAKAASHVVVYGAWTGQSSLIKAVDLASGNINLLATLPMEIKKISVIDDRTILYIDQVDKRDHGKKITVYDIKDKKELASIPAAEGYGIDEYTLSPDKTRIALWEVSFAQGSEVLYGGKSRVYTAEISKPTVKNLLYDEPAAKPVHYPRAILDNGTIFSDKFMPNDPNGGAGWAYGMSVSNFTGSSKKELDSMKAGTYGTQPTLSQDGKYLLFSGYDGTYGDGNAIKRGIRQAILTPNTVDLVNTQTLQRYKLGNLPNSNSYPFANWDLVTGKIILSVVGETADKTGLFAYDIPSKSSEEIVVPLTNNMEYMPITSLTANRLLTGSFEEKASNLGNLGANYEYAYGRLAIMDIASAKSQEIALEDAYAQYITLLPAGYFNAVLGTKTMAQARPQPTFVDQFSGQNDTKQRLQLYTFFLKYDLQPVRQKQQSTPITTITKTPSKVSIPKDDDNMEKCNDVTARVCAEKGQGPETKDYVRCKGQYKSQNMNKTCDDSPLYLYGKTGQKIQVTINTPIYNAIPSYNSGYSVTLMDDGKMQINNKTYERISYDYTSNLRIRKAPKEGTIASRENVETILRDYAAKMGFNEKETSDLVKAGIQKVTSPYVFISFFDHDTSHQILPITFNPHPDNYRNIVFYFKLLHEKPVYTPAPPVFPEPVKRSGFTAVEISEVVE